MIRKILYLVMIASCGFFLHTKGINWGIPDRERIFLVFGDMETLADMTEPMLSTHQEIQDMQVYYGAAYKPDYDTSRHLPIVIKGKKKHLSVEMINSMRSYLLRSYGADEQAVLASLGRMDPSRKDFNPHFFEYGGTYLYPLGAFLKLCCLRGLIEVKNDMRFYFNNPERMGKLYTYSRLFGAILFVFSAIIFYFLCVRIINDSTIAFLISLLFVSVPGFAIWSHYLKPYTAGMLWVISSLYFIFRYIDERKTKWCVISSIFAGFAMGSLLSYGYIFISIILGILFFTQLKNYILRNLVLCFLCFVFSFIITNPYAIISWKEFVNEISYIQSYWKNSGSIVNLKYFISTSLRYGLGNGIWLIFILSFFIALSRFEKKFAFVLLSLLPGLIYFGIKTGKWVHYSFIVYPYIFLLIALATPKIKKYIAYTAFCFAFLWTFIFTFSHVRLFTQENTRTIAGRWINENIKEGTNIGLFEFPSPWRTPPFQYLKYNIYVGTEDANKVSYYVVSMYQWIRGSSLQQVQKMLSDFEIIEKFEKDPEIFKYRFSYPESIPYDWCHPNPVILIWKKKS